ncbi:MAG: HIRAN domain-containing protein [Bacteroidales bacterium]|jgi:hypothetical protein|nr:HIRAN domain-containing protein [Bacteroidales bacterium]
MPNKWEEREKKMEETGKKMQRVGCMLTGLITLPIIGVLIGGPIGLVIGFIIGILMFIGALSQGKREKQETHSVKVETRIEGPTSRAIKINAHPAAKFTNLVAKDVAVAGISYRQNTALKLIEGSGRKIVLEKEPDNEYDKNAIKVLGKWVEGDKYKTEQVGYVPKEVAAEIAKKYPDNKLEGCLRVIFKPTKENSAGIRFDIYAASEDKHLA